jgi:hypothetical protein
MYKFTSINLKVMGPSDGKYKSMYCNESEVGAGNPHKREKVVHFGLFHVIHNSASFSHYRHIG